MTHVVQCVLISLLGALSIFAQGTFQNLGFESAVVVPYPGSPPPPPSIIQFAPAFPGWVGYLGTQQVDYAFYNTFSIGTAVIGMMHSNFPMTSRIAGRFTPLLQSGNFGLGITAEASLRQTGTVPAGMESLRFLADGSTDSMMVLMNGQSLSIIPLQVFNGYSEFGVNISQFAGQTAELRFVQPYIVPSGGIFLDNISFSPIAVPEPSTWALLGLGSALFWCAARRRRK